MPKPRPDPPPYITGTSPPSSSCCGAPLEVTRPLRDTGYYAAVLYRPARGKDEAVLHVRFAKTEVGESGDYEVSCSHCHLVLDPLHLSVEES